jgi:hypothetical protein
LLAAVLIGNADAFTVVTVEMLSLAIVALSLLVLTYERYERLLLHFVSWTTARLAHLALFLGVIFLIPILLAMT